MDRDPYAAPDCGPPPTRPSAMPAFSPLLLRAAMATLGGLVLGCGLVVIAVFAWFTLTSQGVRPVLDQGARVIEISLFALLFGGLPALMIGAPGYALLVRWGWANVLTVAVLGAAPGLALLAHSTQTALLLTGFGIVVALVTHALFQFGKRPGSGTG